MSVPFKKPPTFSPKVAPKFDRRLHKPAPENIRRIIASKGLTNAQAAKSLGVSVRTVNAWTSETDANHREPHYVYQFALESLEGK